MAAHALPRLAEHGGDRRGVGDLRHVAGLAAPLGSKGTVAPFEVRHLLGERRRHLAVRAERPGVERVAGRAELGLLDVGGLGRRHPGCGVHHPCAARVDPEWTEDGRARCGRRVHDEAASEALRRSKPFAADLVTERAGDTVGREPAGVRPVASDGQVREDLSQPAGGSRGRSSHRHVAGRALVLDLGLLRRVIDRLASDRRLPVGIARRVGHHRAAPRGPDRHVFARWRGQAVVARQAVVGGLEVRRTRGPPAASGPGAARRQVSGRSRARRGTPQGRPPSSVRQDASATHRTSLRRTSPTGSRSAPACRARAGPSSGCARRR